MQSIPHSMAHRGAGATRTNARWHPYTPPRAPAAGTSTPSCTLLAPSYHQSNSQEAAYLITPAPSVYSTSPSSSSSSYSQSPFPPCSAPHQAAPLFLNKPQIPKVQPTKANYVASLVGESRISVYGNFSMDAYKLIIAVDMAYSSADNYFFRSSRKKFDRHLASGAYPGCIFNTNRHKGVGETAIICHSPMPITKAAISTTSLSIISEFPDSPTSLRLGGFHSCSSIDFMCYPDCFSRRTLRRQCRDGCIRKGFGSDKNVRTRGSETFTDNMQRPAICALLHRSCSDEGPGPGRKGEARFDNEGRAGIG